VTSLQLAVAPDRLAWFWGWTHAKYDQFVG